jgi:cysteinyl-tRNA synthetase
MSRKYLGPTFDIHGGGIDNIYPHNENEIAQSECANDADFARYWMLVGSLNVPDEDGIATKMSKSLGNFVTIKDALNDYRPEVIRTFILNGHYSNPVVYSDESLAAAKGGWERLYHASRLVRRQMNSAPENEAGNAFLKQVEAATSAFTEAMDDDFNTPKAVAVLQDLTREVNSLLNSEVMVGLPVLQAIDQVYRDLGGAVLGVIPEADLAAYSDSRREEGLITLLIDLRAKARSEKNYAESDRIRDALTQLGVTLEDRSDGTIWRVE